MSLFVRLLICQSDRLSDCRTGQENRAVQRRSVWCRLSSTKQQALCLLHTLLHHVHAVIHGHGFHSTIEYRCNATAQTRCPSTTSICNQYRALAFTGTVDALDAYMPHCSRCAHTRWELLVATHCGSCIPILCSFSWYSAAACAGTPALQ